MEFPFQVDVTYLLSLILLLFTFISSLVFVTIVRQRFVLRTAVKTQRSIYKKRVIQALNMTFVLSLLLFILSALDYFIFKKFFSLFSIELYYIARFIPFITGLTALLIFISLYLTKGSEKISCPWVWFLLAIFASFKAWAICLSVTLLYFYNVTPTELAESQIFINAPYEHFLFPFVDFINKVLAILQPLTTQGIKVSYYIGFYFLSGICLSYAVQMQYVLLSRNSDNFGRDYYMQTLHTLAVSTAVTSSILILYAAIVPLSTYMGSSVFTFSFTNNALILLLFPLSALNYIITARSNNALRHKITILISPLFLFIAATFFIYLGL